MKPSDDDKIIRTVDDLAPLLAEFNLPLLGVIPAGDEEILRLATLSSGGSLRDIFMRPGALEIGINKEQSEDKDGTKP